MLVLLAGAAIVATVVTIKNTLQHLTYSFQNFSIDWTSTWSAIQSGSGKLYGSFQIALHNAENSTLTVQSMLFNIFYQNQQLAQVSDDNAFTIAPKQTTVVPIDFTINLSGVPSVVASLLKKKTTAFNITGNIETSGFNVPIPKQVFKIGN